MGKVIFDRDRGALKNSPLILKQLSKAKNKSNKQNVKKIKPYVNVTPKTVLEAKDDSRKAKKRRPSNEDFESDVKKARIENNESEHIKLDSGISDRELVPNNTQLTEAIAEETKVDIQLEASATVEVIKGRQVLNWTGDGAVDIFHSDELNCSYEQLKCLSIYHQLIDEICLEGLDGITLEALWTRLKHSIQLPLLLHKTAKELLWRIICYMDFIKMYILPYPRKKLMIYDRFKQMDLCMGVVKEPDEQMEDIYPYCPVIGKDVRGSCSTFNQRELAPDDVRAMSYKEVTVKFGNKLVLVADQDLRQNAIHYEIADPQVDFVDIEYHLLERVGRARRHGELTQGRMSLQDAFHKDAKTLFHNRKELTKQRLITKQFFYIKTNFSTKMGGLVHLCRFYNRRKSKQLQLTEQIFNAVKQKPLHRMEFAELRRKFGNSPAIPKVMKTPEFQKFIRTDVYCRYRELYPHAKRSEWKYKASQNEKTIRVLQIIDPYVNVEANWSNEQSSDDESSDDEVENKQSMDPDYLRDVYSFILSKGKGGADVKVIRKHIELDFYTLRTGLKKLVDRGHVLLDRIDVGRQRRGRYVAACFANGKESTPQLPKPMQLRADILEKIKNCQRQQIASLPPEERAIIEMKSKEEITVAPTFSNTRKLPHTPVESKGFKLRFDVVSGVDTTKVNDIVDLGGFCKIISSSRRICLRSSVGEEDIIYSFQTDSQLDGPKDAYHFYISKNATLCSERYRFDSVSKLLLIKALLNEVNEYTSLEHLSKKIETLIGDVDQVNSQLELIDNEHVDMSVHKHSSFEDNSKKIEVLISDVDHLNGQLDLIDIDCVDMSIDDQIVKPTDQGLSTEFDLGQDAVVLKPTDQGLSTDFDLGRDPVLKPTDQGLSTDFDLGQDAVVLRDEIGEENIHIKLISSKEPPQYIPPGTSYISSGKMLTERVVIRLNMVLELVNTHKIFEQFSKLLKIIEEREFKSGYKKQIDRKSLKRLVERLIAEGYIKIYKLIMAHGNQVRTQTFLCLPDVPPNHSLITATCEQFKMKFFVSSANKGESSNKRKKLKCSDSLAASSLDYKKMVPEKYIPKYKFDRRVSKIYGYKPKFLRMQVLHEFLFYLVYQHNQQKSFTKKDMLDLLNTYQSEFSDIDLDNVPQLYSKEISWKMFVPPLPSHKGWELGWTLVCDVLLRLPLSIFIKLHSVQYVVPELNYYLNHPVKRHFLLRYLPESIRNVLFFRRKHLFSIHETLVRLCYIGLLQFGPQKFREKDQVFIYLNRRASLYDTVTSEPNYHKVTDKPYKKLTYYFDSQSTLEDYWCNLWAISMGTPLGKRVGIGNEFIIEDPDSKPVLIEALRPKDPEIACQFDNGEIPGDKLGAAGIDSSLWVHLKRNWLWATHNGKVLTSEETSVVANLRQEKINQVLPEPIDFNALSKLSTKPNKIFLPPQNASNQKQKPKKSNKSVPKVKKSKVKVAQGEPNGVRKKKNKDKVVLRKFRTRKKALKQYCDAVDKGIIREFGSKHRAKWTQHERLLVKLIKAASLYLTPWTKKNYISFVVMRDVLRIISPASKDKTSSAVQRRLAAFFKHVSDSRDVETYAENLSKLEVCRRYFSKICSVQDSSKVSDNEIIIAFIYLVGYLHANLDHVFPLLKGRSEFVDYFSPENMKFYSPNLIYEDEPSVIYEEPETLDDIRADIVKSVVHSSLACQKNEIGWSYQVFRVYQKYPDHIVRKAIAWLKNEQIVSFRKRFNVKKAKLSHIPYQLSNLYVMMQSSTFTTETAVIAFSILEDFYHSRSPRDLLSSISKDKRYGVMLGLNELFSTVHSYTPNFDIPDVAFTLNPEIQDHSEVIRELAVRYQLKLQEKQEDDCEEDDIFSEESLENGTPIRRENNFKTDTIPDVEEIMKGMMEPTLGKRRKVPHISDLMTLLSREKFPNLHLDDETLDRLKSHFILLFPRLRELTHDGCESLNENEVMNSLISQKSTYNLKEEVNSASIVGEPRTDCLENLVREAGGDQSDLTLVDEIIKFVRKREHFGVKSYEIKEKFSAHPSNLELHILVKLMVKCNVLLRAGVTELTFVYCKCRLPWLVETFILSPNEKEELHMCSKEGRDEVKDKISKRIQPTDEFLIQVTPWAKVDGTVNEPLLNKWLSTVLSHCVENPCLPLKKLFVKFSYVKPVDMYQLVEYLQELGAAKIFAYENQTEIGLFSECTYTTKRPATCLDRFDDMVIEVHNLSMLCLGSGICGSSKSAM